MKKVTTEEMRDVLRKAGLEDAGKDVVFPLGAKIVEIGGKNYLQPMTADEYAKAYKKSQGRDPDPSERGICYYTPAGCVNDGCRQNCDMYYDTMGWHCVCLRP